MKKIPSIFNDVIGPVMRGPSSSHTAASWRIARTSLEILNDKLFSALIEFDRNGAWAPNYREQGTCMGIEGGLLGFEVTDKEMKDTEMYLRREDIEVRYQVSSFPTDHANTVRLTLQGKSDKKIQITAVSLGGGSFEIRKIDGFNISLNGAWYELLIFANGLIDVTKELAEMAPSGMEVQRQIKEDTCLYECKSSVPFNAALIQQVRNIDGVKEIAIVNPILPIVAGRQTEMPFTTLPSLLAYTAEANLDLARLGMIYERCVSGLPDDVLNLKMKSIIDIIHSSIDTGLQGTEYKDRILPQQSHLIERAEREEKINNSIVTRIIANVSALMESKSAMEVVVAVPTAGSCGTVGGSLRAVAQDLNSTNEELTEAYFAAGIVGAYFAQGPGFSAEEHGCQVECGASAGMAAAGMVQLMGGTATQAIGAASMAIQNMIGLVCDPVADRVEVPCLGKNISAAVNAYSSALMAVSGFDPIIPLDQVIQTVSRVSAEMPTCVKCTGKGGLAITEQSIKLKRKLEGAK